jgi:hypothetical protein
VSVKIENQIAMFIISSIRFSPRATKKKLKESATLTMSSSTSLHWHCWKRDAIFTDIRHLNKGGKKGGLWIAPDEEGKWGILFRGLIFSLLFAFSLTFILIAFFMQPV